MKTIERGVLLRLRADDDASDELIDSAFEGALVRLYNECERFGEETDTDITFDALAPQLYVNVKGGVAETSVTRGGVEVIHVDWDDVEAGDLEFARETREEIEKVADEAYRARLLADIDKVIADLEEDEEAMRTAEIVRQKTERLRRLEIVFEETGGRGVDVAEEIDTLRSELEVLNAR